MIFLLRILVLFTFFQASFIAATATPMRPQLTLFEEELQKLQKALQDKFDELTTEVYHFDCKLLEGSAREPVTVLGESHPTGRYILTRDIWQYNCGEISSISIKSTHNRLNVDHVVIIDDKDEHFTVPRLSGVLEQGESKSATFLPIKAKEIVVISSSDAITETAAKYQIFITTFPIRAHFSPKSSSPVSQSETILTDWPFVR